mgnify:CR=1 FL=1
MIYVIDELTNQIGRYIYNSHGALIVTDFIKSTIYFRFNKMII